MFRLFFLLLVSASVAFAGLTEETKLARNTVMRSQNSLVVLKAGTIIQIVEHGEKTLTIKVDGKLGTIPWSALDPIDANPAQPVVRPTAPSATSTPAPVAAAAPAAPSKVSATEGRPAQSMYGRMVEKARQNEAAHNKNLVKPSDDVLDGK